MAFAQLNIAGCFYMVIPACAQIKDAVCGIICSCLTPFSCRYVLVQVQVQVALAYQPM